ncbi:MAG: hypothetical protein ACKPFF_37765 [Planktothrix sp.]
MKFDYQSTTEQYIEFYGEMDEEFKQKWDLLWGNTVDFNSHLSNLDEFVEWLDSNIDGILDAHHPGWRLK